MAAEISNASFRCMSNAAWAASRLVARAVRLPLARPSRPGRGHRQDRRAIVGGHVQPGGEGWSPTERARARSQPARHPPDGSAGMGRTALSRLEQRRQSVEPEVDMRVKPPGDGAMTGAGVGIAIGAAMGMLVALMLDWNVALGIGLGVA